jgi:hypothetical protein
MKLQELANTSQVKQVTQILESYFDKSFEFSRLTESQTKGMLQRVRRMIKEERSSSKLHTSERDPAYLKLIMLEQALSARLVEYTAGQQQSGPAEPIIRGGKSDEMMQRRQAQSQMGGTSTSPVGAAARPIVKGKGVSENKKKKVVYEASELQQAQVVLASQDMIDQLQSMIEDISEMQFKDLPALVDQAKAEVGPGNATQFQQAATQALTSLLQAVQQGKTAMEGAQGALTGQAPVPIVGAEGGGEMPAGEMPAGEMPAGEMPAGEAPATPAEPEPAPSGRALGRGRRK